MTQAITELTVEEAALSWLQSLGYATVEGPGIAPGEPAPERSDFGEMVLKNRLHAALARLNPGVPNPVLEEALRKVTRIETPSLVENKRLLTDLHRERSDSKPFWA